MIYNATAEYNSTTPALVNWTVSGLPGNWTNYTINTNVNWLLGIHAFKFYAGDKYGNWNTTLWYLNFEVWGWASITNSSLSNYTIIPGQNTTMYCRVTNDGGNAIANYNVSFYNSTSYLGSDLTNSTGWARITYTSNILGYENLTCNITDDPLKYYNDSASNKRQETLNTVELELPWYNVYGQNASKIYKGDSILFYANWTDNYALGYAMLSSNESGTWKNNSLTPPIDLNGSYDWSNFSVTIPMNSSLGIMGWRIYANDTSNNWNWTPISTVEVWTWVLINESNLNPSIILENDSTTMSCRVLEENNSPVSNYNVTFYGNGSLGYLGWNSTGSDGWAYLTFNVTQNGTYAITCNITNDTIRYMDVMPDKQNATKILTVKSTGEDVEPPYLFNNIYGINTTSVYKGNSLLIYARWNESIDEAYVEFNSTTPSLITDNITLPDPNPQNWTNYTIQTNASWLVGVHVAKIYASDLFGNWNNTLAYLTFEVWGRSRVDWYSPTGKVYRGLTTLRCNVTDYNSGGPIAGYTVDFYDPTMSWIGSNDTNSSGIASLNYDVSGYSPGPSTFTCIIDNEDPLYYTAVTGYEEAYQTVNITGKLNVTIDNPPNGSTYHKGDTLNLNSTTIDENNTQVTPGNTTWYNATSQIATGEDTAWQIPAGHGLGPQIIKINVSKQYYDSDEDNITLLIWGWSNITWTSPDGGNASQGSTIPLICQVMDVNSSTGIMNYPVRFYYKNSTESGYNYLGVDLTNSTGYAVYDWNTVGLPLDNYTTLCNITDNSSLYYNDTVDNKANTTISLATAGGILEVYLMLPPTIPGDGNASLGIGYEVGQNKTFFIQANVTCRNSNCGNVQGTVRYNVTALPDTPLNTSYDTPFYIVDSVPLNPKSCQNNPLNVNDSCILNWTVNSTGALLSIWKLDVLFDGESAVSNNTNYTNIKITKVLIMKLSANDIDWGILDPQTTCEPAPNNPITITLDSNSNDADGIYIKGENLVNGSEAIGITNVTWCKCIVCLNGQNMTTQYELIQANVNAGTDINTSYWIDIPAVPALRYRGEAYVMANATL